MERRDDLSFCQEMKFRSVQLYSSELCRSVTTKLSHCFKSPFSHESPSCSSRNKMVEYLTDWVMGTSNQAADDDIKCLTRCSSSLCMLS